MLCAALCCAVLQTILKKPGVRKKPFLVGGGAVFVFLFLSVYFQ